MSIRPSFYYNSSAGGGFYPHLKINEPIWTKSASVQVGKHNLAFSQPIEPSVTNIKALENLFNQVSYPYRYADVSSIGDYACNVRRFLISLDAYKESKNPLISPEFILSRAHDPKFAKELKRIKAEAIHKTFQGYNIEYEEGFNKNSPYEFNEIGDIFNYAYLPHFIEECEDHLKSFTPLNQSQKWLNKYRKMAHFILSDLIMPDIKKEDILKDRASSSYYDGETIPQWKVPQSHSSQFSYLRQEAKRTVIQVSPENARDALILDPADLNTVSLIESTIYEILEINFKKWIPGRNNNSFIEKFQKKIKKYCYFYMRDIEKEGLTRPRNLITIILEELHKLYPDVDAFKYNQFFSRNPYWDNNTLLDPPRGTGLGFCNSLVSIMQIIVWALIDRNMQSFKDEGESIKMDYLVLNDDIIGFFEDEEELEFFKDSEIEVFNGLGLIRKEQKSFHSAKGGVFCEIYFKLGSFSPSMKESYLRRCALLPMTAQNVTHAKSMIDRSNIYCLEYLREIQLYWGWEFSRDEFTWPSSFGGWLSETYKNISLFEFMKDDMNISEGLGAAYLASKIVVRKVPSRDDTISHRFLFLDKDLRKFISDNLKEICPIDIEVCKMEDLYCRIKFSKELFTRYWNLMMLLRQKIYLKNYGYNYRSAFEDYYMTEENDILPADEGSIFYEIYEGKSCNDPFAESKKFRSIQKYIDRDYTGSTLCSIYAVKGNVDGSYYVPSKDNSTMVQNFLSIARVEENENNSYLLTPEDHRKILRPNSYIEVSREMGLQIPAHPANTGERKILNLRNTEHPGFDDFIFKAYLFNWINSNELLFYLQGDEFLKKAIRKDLKRLQYEKNKRKLKKKGVKFSSSTSSSNDDGQDPEGIVQSLKTDPDIRQLINTIQQYQGKSGQYRPYLADIKPREEVEETISFEREETIEERIYRLNKPAIRRTRGTWLFTDGFELKEDAPSYYNGAVFPDEMPVDHVQLTPAYFYDINNAFINEDTVYPFDRLFRLYLAGSGLLRIGGVGRASDFQHLKTADDWTGKVLGFTDEDIPEIESYFFPSQDGDDDPPVDFGDW